jgi:ech hydrogenase subunit D
MMTQDQTYELITVEVLLEKVRALRERDCRLVQISATRLPEHLELTYSYETDGPLLNLRLHVPAEGAKVPSISSFYWCAFLYENEMHDLFNLTVEGMAVDFHGNFYNTTIPYAFGSTKPVSPPPKPAPAPTPKPAASPAPPSTAPDHHSIPAPAKA